jgi:hypothetical protein
VSWTHTVEAYNTAVDSTNRMHDDDVARTYGFRGGLVPGVDVWAYMTRPCVDRWGRDFLTHSVMEARFVAPVYDGEVVVAELTEDGALSVTGPDGVVRATGQASLVDHLPEPERIDAVARDGAPPAASERSLAEGTALGTLRLTHDRDLGAVYLREVRDDHPIYESGAVCHPGFVARLANAVLHRNVVLGPWIHVGTRAIHRGVARAGAELEVRGRVVHEGERKGHRLVDLVVEVSADGSPLWSAVHTAIWRPRSTA